MSQVKTIFENGGFSFSFDIRDAEDSEKYEAALEEMKACEASMPKSGKLSELTRAQCEMLRRFLDGCLGEGAGEKLCTVKDELGKERKNNIAHHYKIYEEFLELIREQKEDVLAAKNTFSKFSNRQQRRAAENK